MRFPRLRDMPRAIKLWIVIVSFVIPCLLIMSFAFKSILTYTRDATIFSSIEKSQEILKNGSTGQKADETGTMLAYRLFNIGGKEGETP